MCRTFSSGTASSDDDDDDDDDDDVSADMIELTDVVTKCTDFLKAELHESNALGIHRSGTQLCLEIP